MRVLVTNDDGIHSEGLRQLALVSIEAGLDTVIAAPLRESSGSSASLTAVEADGRIVVEERRLEGCADTPTYGVGAVPAFIVLIAARGAFGPPPDVVMSGINRGANAGHAVLHSGTVGAVFTGATHGCRGMAVSIAVNAEAHIHWETAADVARRMLTRVTGSRAPLVLNVNVPNVALDELHGLRRARLASFGAVQTNIAEAGQGFVKLSVADVDAPREPGTDAAFIADGYATLTALQPLCEAESVTFAFAES
jgi:5'-nucleotidase